MNGQRRQAVPGFIFSLQNPIWSQIAGSPMGPRNTNSQRVCSVMEGTSVGVRRSALSFSWRLDQKQVTQPCPVWVFSSVQWKAALFPFITSSDWSFLTAFPAHRVQSPWWCLNQPLTARLKQGNHQMNITLVQNITLIAIATSCWALTVQQAFC